MPRLVRIQFMCGVLILQAGAAMGQSMMEVSAAAANGSVAGVAGKKVSEGVDTIFGKLAKQTNAAAETKKPAAPRSSASVEVVVPPGPVVAGVSRPGSAKPAKQPDPLPGEASAVAPAPEPAAPVLTGAQLAEIKNGASRGDVLAKLGTPYARIVMPEDSHVIEIYQYMAKGQLLGAVRLTDGVVSTVRVDAR